MQKTNCNYGNNFNITQNELPSRFMEENKCGYPVRICPNLKYHEFVPILDTCYYEALKSKATINERVALAAENISKFYQSLQPIEYWVHTQNPCSFGISTYNIAKKFAKIAADHGRPNEYIFLTGTDYGAGREMVEHTRWVIKSLKPYDDSFFGTMNSMIEPRYLDKDSRLDLEKYLPKSFREKCQERCMKAFMLVRGFYGGITEQNDEKAFKIACKECVLIEGRDPSTDLITNQASFIARMTLSELVKKHGYDLKADPYLHELGMPSSCTKDGIKKALKIIQQSTLLLQYYNIVPEQICKQLKENKISIRLDLHGYKKDDSIIDFFKFINYMVHLDDRRSWKVITGKGNHSPNNQPILKPLINSLLGAISETYQIEYELDSGGGAFKIWKKL